MARPFETQNSLVLKGNPRGVPVDAPAPATLREEGIKVWRETLALIHESIEMKDLAMLEAYCLEWQLYREMYAMLPPDDLMVFVGPIPKPHPLIEVMGKSMARIERMAKTLRLVPDKTIQSKPLEAEKESTLKILQARRGIA